MPIQRAEISPYKARFCDIGMSFKAAKRSGGSGDGDGDGDGDDDGDGNGDGDCDFDGDEDGDGDGNGDGDGGGDGDGDGDGVESAANVILIQVEGKTQQRATETLQTSIPKVSEREVLTRPSNSSEDFFTILDTTLC